MGRSTGVSPGQRRTLDRLKRLPALRGYYLAGGTAIAAHLGHRRSLDLDLFSRDRRADLAQARRAIIEGVPGTSVVDASDVAMTLLVGGAPLDVVQFPYPLVGRTVAGPAGFPMAGLRDLAAMKLAAIGRRGIRRDFWDLHTIVTEGEISLTSAARTYVRRFGVAEADLYGVMRSLTYFVDADNDPIWPAGLTEQRWRRIKTWFDGHAGTLLGRSR